MRITKSKTANLDFDRRLENNNADKADFCDEIGVVTAILGPTNTGKTHLAITRMLGYNTGMIGLPLRLLAREIYDRVIKLKDPSQVALITGEEKIIPKNPNYFICTVEAMPRDLRVEFMAIDEIQLAGDPQRGHIFTNRLLNYRGNQETMFLGAETMSDIIKKLLPDVTFLTRPRLSSLSYAGQKKLSRLPRKTAIVAFSANQVYEIAELIRRQKGGAAVVLGSLSPRTRNAQVALYQSGEVDYLVATDAIGMGLNLDVDHVAFAGTRKFDGKKTRYLTNAELAQIAGRAGRFKNDGTFGITATVTHLDEMSVHAVEEHEFEAITHLQWRSNRLDFSTIHNLIISLNRPSEHRNLVRAATATDQATLEYLTKDQDVMELARGTAAVKILWEVASIPDFRRVSMADHATLVSHIYRNLMQNDHIDNDWFAKQVRYSDNVDGDIDALSNRIAHIRSWTYIANRPNWVENVGHWRHITREIENRLSDALHERLTQRFVDKRTSLLMSRLREKEEIMADVSTIGEVKIEDEFVGTITGLTFELDKTDDQGQEKALRSASLNEVSAEISRRVDKIVTEEPCKLSINDAGKICWEIHPIATIEAGDVILNPYVKIIDNNYLSSIDAKRLGEFAKKWLNDEIENHLASLIKLNDPQNISGIARGIAFQMVENFGILVRNEVNDEIKALDQDARKQLRRFGVRFGAYHIFIPQLLKPAPTKLLMLLAALQTAKQNDAPLNMPPHPGQGLTSVGLDANMSANHYKTAGFRKCVNRAVRIDMLERLADLIRDVLYWKPKADTKPVIVTPSKAQTPAVENEQSGNIVTPDVVSAPSKVVSTNINEVVAEVEVSKPEATADDVALAKAPEPVVNHAQPERPLGTHKSGGFMVTPNMMSLVGCSGDDFSNILTTIGYQMTKIEIEKIEGELEAKPVIKTKKIDGQNVEVEIEVKTHDEVWFPARKRSNANLRANNNRANQNRNGNGNGKKFDSKSNANANGKRKFNKADHSNKGNVNKSKPNNAKKEKPSIAPELSPFAALMALKNKM